jgi:hypothetical protein
MAFDGTGADQVRSGYQMKPNVRQLPQQKLWDVLIWKCALHFYH